MHNTYSDKYIKPYSWQGFLRCEDGWGPRNDIYDFLDTLPMESSLIVEPDFKLVDSNGRDVLADLVLTTNDLQKANSETSLRETDKKYSVSIKGDELNTLSQFVTLLSNSKSKCQLSLVSRELPLNLVIEITDGVIDCKVIKGKMVPCFDDALPVAGW